MKKTLLTLLAVVLLVVAVVLAAPFLIPVDTYKAEIARQVKAQTGRELTIAGDVSLSILPRTQITADQVSFANAAWANEPQMATLDGLQVRVDPFALISGELQVESFVLRQPVIHLAVDEQGRGNWAFGKPGEKPAKTTGEQPADEQPGDAGASSTDRLQDVGLQDVRLIDGRITYADMATGARQEISAVNLSLSLQSLDQPFSADGSLVWNGEKLSLDLQAGAPRTLMAGQTTDVALNLESNPITLDYDGQVTNAQPRKVTGAVTLDIPSVESLAAWAGNPIEAAEGTLQRFQLEGTVNATGQTYAFAADRLVLDKIEGQGDLTLALGGAKPMLEGRLDLAQMDITPYLPEPTDKAAGDRSGQSAGTTSGTESGTDSDSDGASGEAASGGDSADSDGGQPASWSDEPIDLTPLHAANADFTLSVDGIKARDVEVGKSTLGLQLTDGRLQADLTELNLYDGQGTGRVVVDARKETPSIAKTFDLKGLDAKPFLTDVAGFERLQGTGNLTLDVTASGKSQKAMVQNLDGKGAIRFTDGAVIGINLAQMVRNVKSAFTQTGDDTQKTDFAELSGTFTITDGVLKNDDLLLLNPLIRVRGNGQSDIAARTVDYRLTPKAVSSIEGQGGDVQETGIAVPVIVKGPWHDLSYRPDLKSVLEDVVKDPKKLEEQVEKLREGGDLESVLEGLSGGSPSGDTSTSDETDTSTENAGEATEQLEDDAEKALKSLFGE